MKKLILATVLVVLGSISGYAQFKYVDAAELSINGQFTNIDCDTYHRIPAKYMTDLRESLQWQASNSTGMYVRFRSNSVAIAARWSSRWDSHMNHMTDTGVRGLDLYVLDGDGWKFLGAGRPAEKSPSEYTMIYCMDGQFHEYMLYLPLYESITKLEIGVDAGAVIEMPKLSSPSTSKKIVMYGSSILQGGCASRPGMAFTNILSRRLDREVLNFGFSGNALLDLQIARIMAMVDNPALFFLDYCPNASPQDIKEKGLDFVKILREAHPDVPIIIIDDVFYNGYGIDWSVTNSVDSKAKANKELMNEIRQAGIKKVYHISGQWTLGNDTEPFVDGTHFTDLGMMRYAEFLQPVFEKRMLQ